MSRAEWQGIYDEAWSLYYTPDHMKTLLRRAAATKVPMRSMGTLLMLFATTMPLEKVHPLQGGILRLRHPSERRPDMKPEAAWRFWPRFVGSVAYKFVVIMITLVRVRVWRWAIERDPRKLSYMDQALTPVTDDDDETLDLMTKTTGGMASVAHARKVAGRVPTPAA